jgi:hypothetical protein
MKFNVIFFPGFGIEACCLLGLSFVGKSHQWTALAVLTVGVACSGFAISGKHLIRVVSNI